MKRFVLVAGLATLAGCGISEEKYAEESIRLSCEYIMECFADLELYASVDECITELTDAAVDPDPACVFDAKAAKECLADAEALECPAEGELPESPASCEDVYTDCPVDTDTGA